MVQQKMMMLGKKSSVIREIFEYSKKRKAEIGADKVFDFSIGNPSVPAPKIVNDTIKKLVDTKDAVELHGYTSAVGDNSVREAIANNINKEHNANINPNLIYMTCGAAASLTITLNAVLNEGEEVIVIAPFFPEYRVFIEKAGGVVKVVKSNEEDFQLDFEALEKAISKNTKAIIINSPNNPSGVILSEDTIIKLGELLNKKQEEIGHEIYLIADEPYRKLAYGGVQVPYPTKYYKNTIVCYSFSKALSLPGERIGYIVVSPETDNAGDVFAAICGAGRALGFVCAPSMWQFVIKECLDVTADTSIYEENRKILIEKLGSIGYKMAKPDGAFYLFMKSLEDDAYKFCERAKKHELLLVPSDDFGFEGYVRIAYCVKTQQIINSLPAFEALFNEYNG